MYQYLNALSIDGETVQHVVHTRGDVKTVIPVDENNPEWIEIQKQVEAGDLTIKDAD